MRACIENMNSDYALEKSQNIQKLKDKITQMTIQH